jgi:hypothetical protein
MKALYQYVLLKTRAFWLGFLVSLALAACAVAPAPTPPPTQPPPTPGAPGIPHTRIPFLTFGTWQQDVTYCQDGNIALKMDVLYPDAIVGAAAPVVVFLHTLAGTKDEVEVTATEELLKRSYVVVAPNGDGPLTQNCPLPLEMRNAPYATSERTRVCTTSTRTALGRGAAALAAPSQRCWD